MLETRRLKVSVKLEPDDFRKVLRSLQEQGWTPAILQSEREFLRLAGVDDTYQLRSAMRSSVSAWRRYVGIQGDLFFRDKDIFYCLSIPTDERYLVSGATRHIYFETMAAEGREGYGLEIGLLSRTIADIDARLMGFANAFKDAVMSTIDGRKTRHMNFEWSPPKQDTGRLRDLQKSNQEGTQIRFEMAHLHSDEVRAANVLAQPMAREILQEISRARFAREHDVLAQRNKSESEARRALGDLKNADLVMTEYLLECKKSNAPLTRLSDPALLKSFDVGKLNCPSCNSMFSEEVSSEIYSLSKLGHQLARKSHWMTIWITQRLCDLGVAVESILWNLSESGEEVDIVVEFLGQLWIFELKDREFGAGDAYPFNYRRGRYRAQKAIIVTTGKVSSDAKRVFEELTKGQDSRQQGSITPVLIEGLDKAMDVLRREVSAAALRYACRHLLLLEEFTGYNLSGVIASSLGENLQFDVDETDVWLR